MKKFSLFYIVFKFSLVFYCQSKEIRTSREQTTKPINQTAYNLPVGYVYCDTNRFLLAQEQLSKLNDKNPKLQIVLKTIKLNDTIDSAISLSLQTCEKLINKDSVYAVVLDNTGCSDDYFLNNDKLMALTAVSFTSAYYQIPVLSLKNHESEFSDKTIYSSFVRMSSSYYNQANVWVELIKDFEWKSVNLIHSLNINGRMLASRFQYLTEQVDIKLLNIIDYVEGNANYSEIMRKVSRSTSKVYLFQGNSKDILAMLEEADKYGLFKVGHVWILSDDILAVKNFEQIKNGVLIAKYVEEENLLHQTFAIIKQVYENFKLNALKKPPSSCAENGMDWPVGRKAYEEIISSTYDFNETRVEFDEDGERISVRYQILNSNSSNQLIDVGEYVSDSRNTLIKVNKANIIWPGSTKQKPDGTKWSAKFKVVVIEEKPFVFKIPKPKHMPCIHVYNYSVECPWSHENVTENYCCYGYCIDLIKILSEKLNFEYETYLVPDGLYGDYDPKTGWNGLMSELLSDKADLILAPFTINPERAAVADFTKPFKYQGITILVKRKEAESSLVSFLQPFKDGLWIMVLLSVHVVAIVLYLLDRFSPFGKFKMSKNENSEEDALNLSRSLWFTWGVLLNSGIGEGTPRSFSARVLGMVWAGFAMIMVASYTANLAAFLVLDRPESGISGINDPRLRNPSENYSYASVKGSAVERYFKRQVELSTMYRTMESNNFETVEEAVEALRKGKIQAFIWDSARLEYEARQSCEFVTTGELFGRSSYAFAFKKGNPWLHKISLSILVLHENGIMEDLERNWILLNNTSCHTKEASPSTLGLTNMAGVFMLVLAGIIGGVVLIFIEISYKKRKDKKIREHEISRKVFAIWRKNVEKRKLMGREAVSKAPFDVKITNLSSITKVQESRAQPRKSFLKIPHIENRV